MAAADEHQFTSKDMLILLNEKMDDVLRTLQNKAEHTEVLKLRERMHAVEGGHQIMSGTVLTLTERVRENRDEIHATKGKVETLERTQMSEEKVAEALQAHQEKQRGTFRWAVSLLVGLGVGNLLVQLATRGG